MANENTSTTVDTGLAQDHAHGGCVDVGRLTEVQDDVLDPVGADVGQGVAQQRAVVSEEVAPGRHDGGSLGAGHDELHGGRF